MKKQIRYQWRDSTGKRHSETFKTQREKELFVSKMKLGFNPDEEKIRQQNMPTFEQFCEVYLREESMVNKVAGVWKQDEGMIKRMLPLLGQKKLTEISKGDFYSLKDEMSRRKIGGGKGKGKLLSPKTVNEYLNLARRILNVAKNRELILNNPFSKCEMRKVPEKKIEYWTIEQRDKFFRYCHGVDREFWRACVVAALTGMRLGELRALRRDQLDFDKGIITISHVYSELTFSREERTKGGGVRYIPMNEGVRHILSDLENVTSEFMIFWGIGLSRASEKIKRIAKGARVPQIKFHGLRHTFCSNLVEQDVDIRKIQVLAGHSDIRVTEKYAHVDDSGKRKAVDKIDIDWHYMTLKKDEPTLNVVNLNSFREKRFANTSET